ncbi:MAG: carboxypeptidase regulatory-like domain-containing protein [Acidobacteriota bacterium]|nr:carboxypeptidase regulatory-like domain-containing protein [Acidobacteriota bacterium]MDH3524706.1 carboxypeptidase regulatory-like domain-containing protein [Acidobacteriota bacterium]
MSALGEQARLCAAVLLVAVLAACGGGEPALETADRQDPAGADSGDPRRPAADVSPQPQPRFDPSDLPLDAALDAGRHGAPFGSDREAVAAFEDAYRDVDLNRMQEIWWRMTPVQRFAAHQAGKALSEAASMGDYQRMLPAEYLLDAENAPALELAAEREARGEEAVAAAPAPPRPGTVPDAERGVLRGVMVVEGSGEPVGGVELIASPTGTAALQMMLGQGENLTAVSAADGSFEIAGIPAGEVSVVGQKLPDYPLISHRAEVVAQRVVEVRIELPAPRDRRLELPVVIAGVVRDELSGEPVAGVHVSAGRHGGATSDERGRYLIAEADLGEIELATEHADYHPSASTLVAERRGRIDHDLSVRPITTGVLEGIVVDRASGLPLAGAAVALLGTEITADAEGRFRLEEVEAGEITLTGRHERYRPTVGRVLLARRATAEARLELEPITEGTVLGVVTDASTGQPLAGARVEIGARTVETGVDGRFELVDVPAGAASVTAGKAVFEPARRAIDVIAAESVEVDLALEPVTVGAVEGRVVDADTGNPLAGAEVSVGARRLTTGEDGRFAADAIDAGLLTLSARKTAYQAGGASVTIEPAGRASALIELEPVRIGTVGGVVRDARTGAPIGGARVAVGGVEVETDAEGRFRIRDVDAGSFAVSARHADYGDGAVRGELSGGAALDLDIRMDLRREDVTQLESALASKGMVDLYGIHFDSGDDQFKPSSLGTLNAVLQVIQRAPEATFRVAGHTDSDGTEAYNQDLSERRARAVIRWLAERGVDAGRLRPAGYGESRPAAPNDTPSGKALNRRVELGFAR